MWPVARLRVTTALTAQKLAAAVLMITTYLRGDGVAAAVAAVGPNQNCRTVDSAEEKI